MKRIGYWFFLLLIGIFSIIPFRLIYLFSDFLAFLFYNVIPYRKKMILNNLKTCFPEKSDSEIKRICKESYRNLSDILLEGIKGFTLSQKQIEKRYRIDPNEALSRYYKEGQSVIGVTAHLTNWEWGVYSSGFSLEHHIVGVYKKLSQPYINDYLIRSRSKFDVTLCEMKETSPYVETLKSTDTYLLMLIADQRPSNPYKAYWTIFLNQDTAFHYGLEKFAFQYNLPVFFFIINRIKRGYYQVDIEQITEKAEPLNKGDVIKRYKDVLEREVLKRPSDWLWSHSRWKHAKPVYFKED